MRTLVAGRLVPILVCLMLLVAPGSLLFAQEGDDSPQESSGAETAGNEDTKDSTGGATDDLEADPWEYLDQTETVEGDNVFTINVGLLFALAFVDGNNQSLDTNLGLGGAGILSYDYMLTKYFSIGGEFGGSFNSTQGANILYTVPFGLRVGALFEAGPFEIPVSIMAGACLQTELADNHLSLAFKLEPGFFWRFNDDWSFGLNVSWWMIPQFNEDPAKSVWGHFMFTSLAARYHF